MLVVVVAGAVFSGGWIAARQFQSPAQREANARPPAEGPIFEQVKAGSLADQVSGSGSVGYSTVTPGAPAVLPAAAVVTNTPVRVGDTVTAGEVVDELNGEPVFILPGDFDFYRPLSLNLSGRDVTQLQKGLRAAGLSIDDAESGTFGHSTELAVEALFQRAGYPKSTTLPLTDVIVSKTLPAVLAARADIGAHPTPDRPLVQLARGPIVVHESLDASAFVELNTGMVAQVRIDGIGTPIAARVVGLKASSSSDGQSLVTLAPVHAIAADVVGRPAVGIITVDIVAGNALLVPTRAVASRGTQSRVLVRSVSTTTPPTVQPVLVKLLGSLAGVTAIKPLTIGTLRQGSWVQVG